MIPALQNLIDEAEHALDAPRLNVCHHCGISFEGRPNRLYCSPRCKKRAENTRTKFTRLVLRQYDLNIQEAEALREGDYHTIRKIRARRSRDISEIDHMLDKTALKSDPKINRHLTKLVDTMQRATKHHG